MEAQSLQLALSSTAGSLRLSAVAAEFSRVEHAAPAETKQAAEHPAEQLSRLLSQQTKALVDLLANLKPARISSEILLRLLQPFRGNIEAEAKPAQDALSRLSPETQRFLLRMSLNLVGLDLSKLLAAGGGKTPSGALLEMIGDKSAISLNNNAALLSKMVSASPGNNPLSRLMDLGQVVNAKVLNQDPNGQLRLLLNGQTLKAMLPHLPQLGAGDSISLQLLSMGNPPQLKVLGFGSQNSPENQLLRQLLPRQGTLQQLFQQLGVSQSGTQSSPQSGIQSSILSSPQSPLQSLSQLAQSLPSATAGQNLSQLAEILAAKTLSPQRINAELISSLVQSSGLFLEANLARKRDDPTDLKSALLRMVAQLRSGTDSTQNLGLMGALYGRLLQSNKGPAAGLSERQQQLLNLLRNSAEGALAKVEIRQLSSLQQNDETRQSWQLALPMLDEQKCKDLELRIQREKNKKNPEEGDLWTVNLHFDFDSSGPMDVRINLQKDSVGVVFWTQWPETLQRVGELMPKLELALERAGLEVKQLSAYPGSAPQPSETPRGAEESLLNVTA
ncbi:MAG: flagellar hook-length control protein FliK [Gammaproteobacteria bacterium]|nr:flagellar hook-length control protein FliK [Gammaproteobacteria bacterium]